jgi:hypothetical protein
MKENPKPAEEKEELKELIRVKIDIYGLTMEDIQDILSRAQQMAEHPQKK